MAVDDPGAYGAAMADVYDDWYGNVSDVEGTVAWICDRLARGPDGPVLELGVGTGRLAIPLAAKGVTVHGVEGSPEMLERLRAKPGGSSVQVTVGDMVTCQPPGPFALVLVAFNTLFNLTAPGAQQRCITNACSRLVPGGRLVVEAFVPDPDTGSGSSVEVRSATTERVVVSVSRHDGTRQLADGEFVEVTAEHLIRRPWRIRWATPDQLDEMAAEAGLEPEGRWASWLGHDFDTLSNQHVTSYRRPRQ